MKKCFKIFGCATVLSTALAFPAFAEIPAQYSELIQSIKEDFANGLPVYNQNTDGSQLSMYYDNSHYRDNNLSGYAYAFMDLDGNGIEELLFVECSDYSIDDIWTIENGNLVHVAHGFARSLYYLTIDGQIVNEWSSGAYDSETDYYRLNVATLEKIKSERNQFSRNFAVQPISYITFDEKPYYVNLATDFEKIHSIDGKNEGNVIYSARYKEYDDCYELPVGVTYFEHPLREIDVCDTYAGEYVNSNFRFTKDATISYINWDTYQTENMPVKEYLEKNNGKFLNCINVHSYNSAGYITNAYWYSAG